MEEKKLSVVIVCKREVMARTRMRGEKKLINYIFLSLVLFFTLTTGNTLNFFSFGVDDDGDYDGTPC